MSWKYFGPHFPTRSLFRLSFINPFGESEGRPLFPDTFYSPVIIRSMFAKDPQKCRSIRKWFIFGLFPLRFVTNLRNDSIIHYSSGRVSLAILPRDSLPFELDFSARSGGEGHWQENEGFINLCVKVFQSQASSSVTSPRDELDCSTFGWISLHFDWGDVGPGTKSGIIFLRRINFHQSFFLILTLKVARRIIYVYRMLGGCLAGNWLEMYYSRKLCSFLSTPA